MKKYYEPEKVKESVHFEPIPEEVRIQYLRPGELLNILDQFPVAFQPVGTVEWHGRQNPLGCDTIKAESLCVETAKKTGGVVMPPIYFATDGTRDLGYGLGCGMDAVAGFQLPGSFYKMPDEILKKFIKAACENYLSRGFKLVIIVSGHNALTQQYLFDEICYELKSDDGTEPVCFTMEYTVLEKENPKRYSDHAGFYETSMMMYLTDGRVNLQANDGYENPNLAISTGKPANEASTEEGKACFELQIEGLAKFAREKLAKLTTNK
ncbi:MAG: creatininase family protein [Oscillospiraceae bacterium]|nr:creatininase family protein [Oscillospiraceae bacterium]